MGYLRLVLTMSMIAGTSPLMAAQSPAAVEAGAPAAAADARYCLRLEPFTGSRIETVRCKTREAWTELGVDVDEEWAREGVRIIGPEANA